MNLSNFPWVSNFKSVFVSQLSPKPLLNRWVTEQWVVIWHVFWFISPFNFLTLKPRADFQALNVAPPPPMPPILVPGRAAWNWEEGKTSLFYLVFMVCSSKLQDTCDFPTPQMYSKQAHSTVMSLPWQMHLINDEALVFCQQSRFSFSPSLISCHLLALAFWDGITVRLSSVGVSVWHLCQWVVRDGFIILSEVLNDSTPGIHSWSRVPETPQATVSFKCWLQHMCQLPV